MRALTATLVAVLLAATLAAPAEAEPVGGPNAPVAALSAVPQAMAQTDGTIWALAYAHGVLYLGGNFTTVRPAGAAPGQQTTAQPRLAAVDAATGEFISSWRPAVSGGSVYALSVSPDGSRLYVGGTFTSVDGHSRPHLAGYDLTDPANPALLPADQFGATTNGKVTSLASTDDTVYAGGYFTTARGVARGRLAAFSAAGGALLPFEVALTGTSNINYPNPFVTSLQVDPVTGRLAVGGMFDNVDGVASHGLGVVDPVTGARDPGFTSPSLQPTSYVVAMRFDAGRLFISGRDDHTGLSTRLEGAMGLDSTTGRILWGSDGHRCLGDTFALEVLHGQLWAGTHAHDCSRVATYPETRPRFYGAVLGADVATGEQAHFYPTVSGSKTVDSGSLNNVRAFATDGTRLFVAGGWLSVNGLAQQDLTAFVPRVAGGASARPATVSRPTASTSSTGAKVSFTASKDADDRTLTYLVYRGTRTTPIGQLRAVSTFWNRPRLVYYDTGVRPGSSVTYRVAATDGTTTSALSTPSAGITVSPLATDYRAAVLADGPATYWKLDEATGRTAGDASGNGDAGTVTSGTFGSPGLKGTSLFLPGGDPHVYSSVPRLDPVAYSMELWFRTTSQSGGRLMGFGNQTSGRSTRDDRHVYLTTAGRLVFGVDDAGLRTITSPASYNDGEWHQVVATQDGSGMTLYVDGAQVGANDAGDASNYSGFFRLGGDTLTGWPDQPTSTGATGRYDEAAFYPHVLGASEVARHWALR